MSKIFSLMSACVTRCEPPEAVLELLYKNTLPFDLQYHGSLSDMYSQALKERFPQVVKLYVTLVGMDSREVLTHLCADAVAGDKKLEALTFSDIQDFFALFQAGISLSWWLFGIGEPMYIQPSLEVENTEKDYTEAVRTLGSLQGWSSTETSWFLKNETGPKNKSKVQDILVGLMGGLPQIKLLPSMPNVNDVLHQVTTAVQNFRVPEDSESWMKDSIELLQEELSRVCLLLFIRRGAIVQLERKQASVRLKIKRLAFAVTQLFELYGEQSALIYYLTLLNEEAKALGFCSLSEVIRNATWQK